MDSLVPDFFTVFINSSYPNQTKIRQALAASNLVPLLLEKLKSSKNPLKVVRFLNAISFFAAEQIVKLGGTPMLLKLAESKGNFVESLNILWMLSLRNRSRKLISASDKIRLASLVKSFKDDDFQGVIYGSAILCNLASPGITLFI